MTRHLPRALLAVELVAGCDSHTGCWRPPDTRRSSLLGLGRPRAGGLTDQVVALADVRRAAGGLGVRRGGSGQVAGELVQVAADGVPAVAVAEHPAQPV